MNFLTSEVINDVTGIDCIQNDGLYGIGTWSSACKFEADTSMDRILGKVFFLLFAGS